MSGETPGGVNFYAPEVSWVYYALVTALIFIAFVQLLRRLAGAWKNRSRHTEIDVAGR